MTPISYMLDEGWKRPALWERLRRAARAAGYDTSDWVRTAMYREAFRHIDSLRPETLDALEISGGPQWKRRASLSAARSFEG